MSVCLATSLLYFLMPPVGCPTQADVAVQQVQDKAYEEWRHSLDFSFLEAPYAACKSNAPHPAQLNSNERCLVRKLTTRCSAADDCLVQCISRGMNNKVGGGCWHLCFESKFSLSKWSEPKGWVECKYLSKRPGS